MPKRSHKDEWAKAMVGAGSKPKPKVKSPRWRMAVSSNMAPGPAPTQATAQGKGASNTGARKGKKPITIPLHDVSPELKKNLVREIIKGGRATVIKGKGKGKGK